MERHPVILSIAGSDCSGGAGIQADIKTISALGGYAASAITAITVQNTLGVRAVQSISPDMVRGQIEAVMDDLQPVAIKIGMINDIQIVRVISDCLQKYSPAYVVYDPVMVSTSGKKLMTDEAIEEIKKEIQHSKQNLTEEILKHKNVSQGIHQLATENNQLLKTSDFDFEIRNNSHLILADVMEEYFISKISEQVLSDFLLRKKKSGKIVFIKNSFLIIMRLSRDINFSEIRNSNK